MFQKDLDAFLALAEELQLKGLRRNTSEKEIEKFPEENYEPKFGETATRRQYSNVSPPNPTDNEKFEEKIASSPETTVALTDFSGGTNLEELDLKVKSMMSYSENRAPGAGGHSGGRARVCNICGKEGHRTYVMQHIEANHMTGLSIPCHLCGNLFCSRNALRIHKSRTHRHGKNSTEERDSEYLL